MFRINEDMSIHATRGDAITINLNATTDDGMYLFRVNDHVYFRVFGKKNCDNVVLEKEIIISEETEVVDIALTSEDTKFGNVISKPTCYWYEVELNSNSQPQTILGYDDAGPKQFWLYPEGGDFIE